MKFSLIAQHHKRLSISNSRTGDCMYSVLYNVHHRQHQCHHHNHQQWLILILAVTKLTLKQITQTEMAFDIVTVFFCYYFDYSQHVIRFASKTNRYRINRKHNLKLLSHLEWAQFERKHCRRLSYAHILVVTLLHACVHTIVERVLSIKHEHHHMKDNKDKNKEI